ncbi:MAG: tRNA (guanine-N(7)-)-methyltransferase [Holosporales bacterium]
MSEILHITKPQKAFSKVYGRRASRPLKVHTKGLYETLLPSLRFEKQRDFPFSNNVYLEIGFGGGEHIAQKAQMDPNSLFIGAEPFVNGVASLLKHIESNATGNIRIFDHDIRLLLNDLPTENVFDGVYLLFADPWPKKRHFKRRFVQDDMIVQIHKLLKPNACWFVATDHADYRAWMLEHFDRHTDLFTQIRPDIYERPDPNVWPITRYEEKAIQEGRPCSYMIYQKI